jgi:hypothetical protein
MDGIDGDALNQLSEMLESISDNLPEINTRFLAGLPPRSPIEVATYRQLTNCWVLLGQVGVPEGMPMAAGLNAYGKWWWRVWEESLDDREELNMDDELKNLLD